VKKGTKNESAFPYMPKDEAPCRLELAILVCEIWCDVAGQPAQRSNRDRRDGGVLGAGRTAPKEGHMSLEVSAFHNVMQLL
jgi:hypothetical protein